MERWIERVSHGVDGFPHGGHDPEECQRTAIDNGLVVDQDFEFAVPTVDHVDLCAEFASYPGRHTGGVNPGDSIRAVPNCDPCHLDLGVYGYQPPPSGLELSGAAELLRS